MTRRRIVNVDDLRDRARRRLPRVVFDFIEGGGETEHTIAANRSALDALTFSPRVLAGVARRSQETRLFGRRFATPVLLAPVGLARLAGHDGEVAAAVGAAAAGSVSIVSTASSVAYADIARATPERQWFQLYLWRDRAFVERVLDEARRAGFEALVVTVDVPAMGGRERDLRNGMTSSFRRTPAVCADAARHPRWLWDYATHGRIYPAVMASFDPAAPRRAPLLAARHGAMIDAGQSWDDVRWIREAWDGPLLLKGVLRADDARRAADCGADGIVVSNHGGRQLDYAPATVDVLPEIADAVGDRMAVLLDGGVRRGTDVVKAIALGARAVLVGRPWLYALAARGRRGPGELLEMLAAEIDRTLALLGRTSLDELEPGDVRAPWRAAGNQAGTPTAVTTALEGVTS